MIINGKQIASDLLQGLHDRIAKLNFEPLLVDVVVGEDPVSLSYVRIKQKTAERAGLKFELVQFPQDIDTETVVSKIQQLAQQPELCGLIVQLPLPTGVVGDRILSAIPEMVDVDLLSPNSQHRFYSNQSSLMPPTAGAILEIIKRLGVKQDSKIVVMGQGELVGRPTAHVLQEASYNVTSIDNQTENSVEILKSAEVLITGIGKSNFVNADMLKSGVVVIDAGTSEAGGAIAGDVDFEDVSKIAQAITPVPGGVGPVTVAKLIENVVSVAEKRAAHS